MDLIRNVGCVCGPDTVHRDLLIAGGKVVAVGDAGSLSADMAAVHSGDGLLVIAGLVDALTHPCGGGGEGGFANRTAEIPASAFATAGVLTPVGALGTDSLGRSLDVLYGNVMSLRARGINALMYSGAYRVPAPSLTGDIARDLVLVSPVIGVGEVAIADHRGSQPSIDELRRLAADVALGGILAGEGGTVMVHVGDGDERLAPLRAVVESSDLSPDIFYPTHVNRSRALLDEAAEWTRQGGYADITVSTTPELVAAGDIPALDALDYLLGAGAVPERVTCSSDAGGSLPLYEGGQLRGLTAAGPHCLLDFLAKAYLQRPEMFPLALAAVTCNPAAALKLNGCGVIATGHAADLVFLDAETMALRHTMGQGEWLVRDGIYQGQDL